MKINEFFISVPPYLSLSWKEVAVIFMKESDLFIKLKSGQTLLVPQLTPEQIEAVFTCHARFLELEILRTHSMTRFMGPFPLPFPLDTLELPEGPLAFKIGTSEGVIHALGHNPALAKSPPLPEEILNKIVAITKHLGIVGNGQKIPQATPECNCFFCQIMGRLQEENDSQLFEEEITEQDLKFADWTIQQTGDQQFNVTNPLNTAEKYSVFLGQPIGCSCGKEGCEHIIAVLKS